jgi:hypothetical protein
MPGRSLVIDNFQKIQLEAQDVSALQAEFARFLMMIFCLRPELQHAGHIRMMLEECAGNWTRLQRMKRSIESTPEPESLDQ